jgi:hypothetical protein
MRSFALLLCFVCACGGTSSEKPGTSITLSGQLTGGTFTQGPLSSASVPPSGALAGYQLSCVTFGTPPAAATATADSNGNFTLTFDALDVPFGCFVLDPSGNSVASVTFTDGSNSSLTASFTQSGNVGIIIVDGVSGLAQLTLPSGGTLVTSAPSGACPLGTWTDSLGFGSSTCGAESAVLWIAQLPSGQYVASFVSGPVEISDAGSCGQISASNPATYSNGVLTFTNPGRKGSCAGSGSTAVLTPDSQCKTATVTLTQTSCGDCTGGSCNGCGTQSCTSSLNSATRQ